MKAVPHSNNLTANFGLTSFGRTVAHADNIRFKEIKKRRALIGKQRVEFLINSVG